MEDSERGDRWSFSLNTVLNIKCRFAVNDDEAEEEDMMGIDTLLLPISRTLAYNWKEGNRREAGVALAHMTGSGNKAHALMSALSKVLKKNDPVRYLEAQMASLRQSVSPCYHFFPLFFPFCHLYQFVFAPAY